MYYAIRRLKQDKIKVALPNSINIAGKVKMCVFDKTGESYYCIITLLYLLCNWTKTERSLTLVAIVAMFSMVSIVTIVSIVNMVTGYHSYQKLKLLPVLLVNIDTTSFPS